MAMAVAKVHEGLSAGTIEYASKFCVKKHLHEMVTHCSILHEEPDPGPFRLHMELLPKVESEDHIQIWFDMFVEGIDPRAIASVIERNVRFCRVLYTEPNHDEWRVRVHLCVPRKEIIKLKKVTQSVVEEISMIVGIQFYVNLMDLKIGGFASEMIHETPGYVNIMGFNEMFDVIALPFVDMSQTFSIDINHMFKYFGVESSLICLFNEFTKLVSYDGGYIHPSHLMLLIDNILYTGQPHPVSRHGMKRTKRENVIQRASFEVTTNTFIEAAIMCREDRLQGNSEKILIGNHIPTGTGAVRVYENKFIGKKRKKKVCPVVKSFEWDYFVNPREIVDDMRKKKRLEGKSFEPESPKFKPTYSFST